MKRWGAVLAAMALATLAAGQAGAQAPAREKLLYGPWACSVAGIASISRATAQFEPGGIMLMSFFNNDPNVTMEFVLSGLWSYDSAADRFSHTVRGARVTNIVVRGAPLKRSQFPGGSAAIEKIEGDFMAQYSTSAFIFVSLTETDLTLKDTGGTMLSCTH